MGDNIHRPPISIAGDSDLYGLMVPNADGTNIKACRHREHDGQGHRHRHQGRLAPLADRREFAAFGGAIRDMWNPNCYGDPGKVGDAEYYCGFEDGGGVHSNSGVPNHLYALPSTAGRSRDDGDRPRARQGGQPSGSDPVAVPTPASDFPDMAAR